MDARTLAGKTLFFILICVFVSGFSSVFGPENNLVGVIIIVLALTMLSRDLSVRPVWNLGVMCACTLAMGAFSFLSVWLGNPFAGAVLNFAFVFGACFYAMHDLNSPMHFPFLLGYAFMLSVPVAADGLPLRLLALVAGSVFVVGLNVLFHHVSKGRREREGMIAICDEVASLCVSARAGATTGTDRLDELCGRMDGYLYERLKSRFLSRPGDRRMLDIVVSLQVLGTVVSLRERDPAVLDGIEDIARRLSSYQKGEDMQPLLDSIDAFLRDRPESDPETRAALRLLRDQLWRLSFSTSADRFDTADIPASFRIGTVLREGLRRDSARFTFSFRMALMFSLCVFVWQYTGDDNAKALAFTTIAMVQPYLEGTARRAALRLAGTVAGIAAAIASLVIAGGDLAVLTAIMLVSNYVFTVLSPMRYEVMMGFVTLSSLLTAIMTNPPETNRQRRQQGDPPVPPLRRELRPLQEVPGHHPGPDTVPRRIGGRSPGPPDRDRPCAEGGDGVVQNQDQPDPEGQPARPRPAVQAGQGDDGRRPGLQVPVHRRLRMQGRHPRHGLGVRPGIPRGRPGPGPVRTGAEGVGPRPPDRRRPERVPPGRRAARSGRGQGPPPITWHSPMTAHAHDLPGRTHPDDERDGG